MTCLLKRALLSDIRKMKYQTDNKTTCIEFYDRSHTWTTFTFDNTYATLLNENILHDQSQTKSLLTCFIETQKEMIRRKQRELQRDNETLEAATKMYHDHCNHKWERRRDCAPYAESYRVCIRCGLES